MAQQAAMAIDTVLAEHADLERQLSDPELHGDAGNARRVGRRFAQLAPIVATYRKLETARGDLDAARELAAEDASFAAEVPDLEARVTELDAHLTDLLAPATRTTPTTSSSRSSPVRVGRSRRCSPPTSPGCTSAMPSDTAGR